MPKTLIRPFAIAFSMLAVTAATTATRDAEARSFVTLTDDGTLAGKVASPDAITKKIVPLYDATGSKRPDVISLWTTFKMDKNAVETLFDPIGNDVTGIGLEDDYGGDGTMKSSAAPLRAILLHNDFTELDARAKLQNAPTEQFAKYIFLLELSHVWGPALRVPTDATHTDADELIGFPFHWSFWMDASGSPAGGNAWKDNGDGTFTTSGQLPKDVKYSMLDLYMMGLAEPSEVQPFGVLEGATPPAGVTDPFTHGAYSKESFPWFGAAPFTVKATRRALTIDDVIAANGARTPARSSSTLNVGIVLVVGKDTTDDARASLETAFDPIADSLVPAFHDATSGRGEIALATHVDDPAPVTDADAGADEGGTAGSHETTTTTQSGCSVTSGSPGEPRGDGTGALAPAALALIVLAARRKRRHHGACARFD
jgi:MYXO-CTERM domain-containing protein